MLQKRQKTLAAALFGALAAMSAATAQAEDTIKVGVIASLTGPFSYLGTPVIAGLKTWMKENGDHVAGKKLELIVKDDGGPNPDVDKRLAGELVTRDHVDFLVGFSMTPSAFAVTPVAAQAHVPMIVMNAATSAIVSPKSPYTTRVCHTQGQLVAPLADWAAKNGIKKVYTLVSDFGPGIDAENYFKKFFAAHGGTIVGSVRVPVKGPEFAPYLQRVKDARPDAVFVFMPAGEQSVSFMKVFAEKQLAKAGIKLIGPGDITDDYGLDVMGDPALGVVTSGNYSVAHDSPVNKRFLKAYAAANPGAPRANFIAVSAYDGMQMIKNVAVKLNGKIDGAKAMAIIKGMKLDSARGPIAIDPATREIVENVYIRRVEKKNGHLYNVEFATYKNVKDPGK